MTKACSDINIIDKFFQEESIKQFEKYSILDVLPIENKEFFHDTLNLAGAYVTNSHVYSENYIMIKVAEEYYIGIVDVNTNGEINTLLFKNNNLAISDTLNYTYDSSLMFENVDELAEYIRKLRQFDINCGMLDLCISEIF